MCICVCIYIYIYIYVHTLYLYNEPRQVVDDPLRLGHHLLELRGVDAADRRVGAVDETPQVVGLALLLRRHGVDLGDVLTHTDSLFVSTGRLPLAYNHKSMGTSERNYWTT